ncbi:serine carboxypeptidase-like 7 [Malania oleifera]|uniref:serine carboxypeptidase-like 7 n=1 Tax=Malania oleifera TaxID=397392 RepID=UPI0025ADCBDB|nr:serine carboxypeptidase-like 7 [Malania oleifera]
MVFHHSVRSAPFILQDSQMAAAASAPAPAAADGEQSLSRKPHPNYSKCACLLTVNVILLLPLFFSKPAVSITTINSLPGFSGSLPFNLETGYIGVGENEDVQLFYYFIESEGNPKEDPLVLWLNGGPGCSALSGLLIEIGPIRFNVVEYNGSLPSLVQNPYSWTKVSSIIFLDAPVGAGFSYSRTLQGSKTGDKSFADQCYDFLRNWLISHPKFHTNPFYVSGDSYSGLIIPIVVQEIADGIENGHQPSINLKGYLLGNPVTDINLDLNSRIPYAHNMGLISDELYESIKRTCNGEYVQVDPENLECAKDLQYFSECTKQINHLHILEPECILICGLLNDMVNEGRYLEGNYVEALLTQTQLPEVRCRNYPDLLSNVWANDVGVQEAIHVRLGTVRLWDRCRKGMDYIKEVLHTVEYHRNLTTRGYQALIYSGDHDMTIPILATKSWVQSLNYSIIDDWRPWLVDGQVAGYSRVYSNGLTFASVKGAGHTAPEDKPKECFAMYKRWISQEPL